MAKTTEPTTESRPKRWQEYMRIDTLPEALVNPKDHDEGVIKDGITTFGFIEAATLDERTGRLIAGHGRRADLLRRWRAGEDPPEGIEVDADGNWLMTVNRGWESANDAQAHAAGVALNEGTIAGGWKRDELAALLVDLQGGPQGLEGTGFTPDGLDDLLASLGDELVLEPQPTDADYADPTKRGEPDAPRETQGIREVGLVYKAHEFREYGELLAKLKNHYGEDAAPLVVLQAMKVAAAQAEGDQ